MPQVEQPLGDLLLAGRHASGRLPPPQHIEFAAQRERRPHALQILQVVVAGVAEHHDIRGRRGREGSHRPGRPGRQHVHHLCGSLGLHAESLAAQPGDGQPLPGRGPVAALGEQHQRVVRPQAPGELGDGSGRDVTPGPDEAAAEPGEQHVDGRVQPEPLGEHDARGPVVAAHQQVHEHERRAGPGVPGEDEHRLRAAHPGRVERLRDRLVHLQPEAEGEAGQAHQRVEEATQHGQVQLLRAGAPQPPGEPDPERQTGHQAGGLAQQVGDPEQPHARQPPAHPAPAYDREGERHDGMADQNEGEQRERDGGQQGHEWRQQDPPEPQRRNPHR